MIRRALSAVARALRNAAGRVREALRPPPEPDLPIPVAWESEKPPTTPITIPAVPARMPPRKPRPQ